MTEAIQKRIDEAKANAADNLKKVEAKKKAPAKKKAQAKKKK